MGESLNTTSASSDVLLAAAVVRGTPATVHGRDGSVAGCATSWPKSRLTGRMIGLGLLDAAMLVVAFLAADLLRCTFWQQTIWPQPPIAVYQEWYWYLWALPVLMLVWPVGLATMGFYSTATPRPLWRLPLEASGLLLLCFSALALFFSRLAYPRMLILLTTALAPLSFFGGRLILALAARVRRWFYDIGLPDYEMYSRGCTSTVR